MTKYPAIQQRAQQEIDNVTEGKRLPTFNDRERLPFVEAVMLEVLRWSPISEYRIFDPDSSYEH